MISLVHHKDIPSRSSVSGGSSYSWGRVYRGQFEAREWLDERCGHWSKDVLAHSNQLDALVGNDCYCNGNLIWYEVLIISLSANFFGFVKFKWTWIWESSSLPGPYGTSRTAYHSFSSPVSSDSYQASWSHADRDIPFSWSWPPTGLIIGAHCPKNPRSRFWGKL